MQGLPIEGLMVFGAVHARQGGPQEAVADGAAKCCARQSWRGTQVQADVVTAVREVRYVIWELLRAHHVLQSWATVRANASPCEANFSLGRVHMQETV